MKQQLPPRPNLQHLREQAKDLLSSFPSADPVALQRFKESLPPAKSSDSLQLSDAQFVIAREHGFLSRQKLLQHVEELQWVAGVWAFASLEVDGSAMPSFAFTSTSLAIDGTRFVMNSPEAMYEGEFSLVADTTPKVIDMHFTEGPEKGNTAYGIYKLAGEELTICLGLVGRSRPLEFASAPGTGHVLEVLVRSGARQAASPPVGTKRGSEIDEAALTQEEASLQGDWVSVLAVRDGSPLLSPWIESGRRVAVGRQVTVSFGGRTFMEAGVRLNPTANPKQIDYLMEGGATQLGTGRTSASPSVSPRPERSAPPIFLRQGEEQLCPPGNAPTRSNLPQPMIVAGGDHQGCLGQA